MSDAYQFPQPDEIQEITVERFAGVDFASHPTKVDWAHSPDARNMIANDTFFPVKRTGYRCVRRFDGVIYGLHRLGDDVLCHAGTKLWRLNTAAEPTLLYEAMNEEKSVSFLMNNKLWLLDGRTYLVYDGARVRPVRDNAYVPTTTISSPPEGGGTSLEAVNLLTPKRINTFVGDGTSRVFQLDALEVDPGSVTCSDYEIEVVNEITGEVTFQTAPPDAGGLANVTIAFAKTVSGDSIDKCRICGMYGGKNDTRVFVSGNPDKPNCDWQSGLYDPTYFPDTGYTRIGTDASEIMGYVRQYDTQVVLKSDGQDAKQYLRTFELDEDDRPSYPLRQGAVSRYACGVLDGTPYYLSPQGVMGIFGTFVTDYRVVHSVSQRIDPRLCEEPLSEAIACVWNGKYYLAVGSHCYVADSRQTENSVPEWYYWENIPANCFLADGDNDRLWFGTADGRVCVFCRETDADAYFDDGAPIAAYWTTAFSPLGVWNKSKTILSCQLSLMPFGYSGADIALRTEKWYGPVHSISFSQFSFDRVDFSRFSFRSIAASVPVPVRRRVRRAQLLQLVIRNAREREPFGLLGLIIRYQVRTDIRQR